MMLLPIVFLLSLLQRRKSVEDRACPTQPSPSDFHIFDQTSAKALNLIADHAAAYAPINAQDLLQRFTLDAAALFFWGHALNTLDLFKFLTQPGCVVLDIRKTTRA
jgi:hypothetical protein